MSPSRDEAAKNETPSASAERRPQTAFASPEDAAAALEPLFGVKAEDFVGSDPAQVGADMQRLAAAYDRQHVLIAEDDGSVTLWIGPKEWAFPAPLVKGEPGWKFDSVTGGEVTRARAMDDNEAAAAQMLVEMAYAQQRYRAMNLPGVGEAYTAKLLSTPSGAAGGRDGLWWDDALGEPRSPLGVVADSAAAGTIPEAQTDDERPGTYRGYRFRVLTSQGASAPGGAMNYVDEQGRLTRGFAIVAGPDRYGDDGRSVFLCSAKGEVFERDFGDDAGATAATPPASTFDPTADWTPYPVER